MPLHGLSAAELMDLVHICDNDIERVGNLNTTSVLNAHASVFDRKLGMLPNKVTAHSGECYSDGNATLAYSTLYKGQAEGRIELYD